MQNVVVVSGLRTGLTTLSLSIKLFCLVRPCLLLDIITYELFTMQTGIP